MKARANILGHIRRRLGRPAAPQSREHEAVRAIIAAHAAGPIPSAAWDPCERFCERARALGSTVDEAASRAEVPRAVARYLAAHSLPRAAVAWPEFAQLDWHAAGITIEARPARDPDVIGITGAWCAIAETGTLVLLSGAGEAGSVSILPETHIAILCAARIERSMEDVWRLLRAERGRPPRAVHFVSGPSRTADIEQTVTLGAHGPYRVHVILVRQAESIS